MNTVTKNGKPKGGLVAVIMLACLMLSGCGVSKIQDIRLTSCELESVSLRGFKSVDAVLDVGVDNPAPSFTILSLDGTLKLNGEQLATYSADTVKIDKKCEKVYKVPCSATLTDHVNVMQFLNMVKDEDAAAFTTDVTAVVRMKVGLTKVTKTLTYEDIDISSYLEQ